MHKTGLNGLGMIAVPVMAAAFGAKLSAGIVLPMLIVGDIIAVLMSLYFVALGFNKQQIIGTVAWLFLTVNLIKIPFHVLIWNTITWETLRLDLLSVPAILIGAGLGLYLLQFIPERPYRFFLMITVALAAIRLMI